MVQISAQLDTTGQITASSSQLAPAGPRQLFTIVRSAISGPAGIGLWAAACAERGARSGDVQRLGSRRPTAGISRDFVDPSLGLAQQFLAAPLQGFAALIDRNRLFQRDLAFLKSLDDRFELFDRSLECQALYIGIGVGVFDHGPFEII